VFTTSGDENEHAAIKTIIIYLSYYNSQANQQNNSLIRDKSDETNQQISYF